MSYKVIAYFQDLQDDKREYKAGDTYPRKGLKVSADRLKELAGNNNKRKMPLIKEVKDAPKKAEEKPAKK